MSPVGKGVIWLSILAETFRSCPVRRNQYASSVYRLVCAFGHPSLVTVLTRCGLPLPTYFLADPRRESTV